MINCTFYYYIVSIFSNAFCLKSTFFDISKSMPIFFQLAFASNIFFYHCILKCSVFLFFGDVSYKQQITTFVGNYRFSLAALKILSLSFGFLIMMCLGVIPCIHLVWDSVLPGFVCLFPLTS